MLLNINNDFIWNSIYTYLLFIWLAYSKFSTHPHLHSSTPPLIHTSTLPPLHSATPPPIHPSTHPPLHPSTHPFLQLSYSSASPALSAKDTYKRFLRVFPPESSFNDAKFDLLHAFNWQRVGTLHQTVELFGMVSWTRVIDLVRVLHRTSINFMFPLLAISKKVLNIFLFQI